MSLINYRKKGDIGILSLDNAANWNVVGDQFLNELETHQNKIDKDKTVRVLLIKQSGDHFCAGFDVSYLKTVSSSYILDNLSWLQKLYSRWQEMPFPVIASVKGVCYGSGMELILGCDLRIAADNARFAIPEVRFGLAPDMGGTSRLTRLVGPGQAKRLIMLCEEIGAEEALRIGLIEKMVKTEQLDEQAMKMAEKLASLAPIGLRFAKKGINVAAESSLHSAMLFEQAQSTFCCGTYDLQEGVAAFLEKRNAEYKGR